MTDTPLSRQFRLVDFRISVLALSSFIFASGGLYVKIQGVETTQSDILAKLDKQFTADEDLARQIDRMSSRLEVFDFRISRNQQELGDLKTIVHDLSTAAVLNRKADP